MTETKIISCIKSILKTDTEYLIQYERGESAKLNILNSHVFKYYMSPTGNFLEYPIPINPQDTAKINVKKVTDYDKTPFEYSILEQTDSHYNVATNKITIKFNKTDGTMSVVDRRTEKVVMNETKPLSYGNEHIQQTLHQGKNEYFFGGGIQNGRFTHKGEVIHIINTNNWVDGGVTSPCPFYWSTNGYGVLRNTWQPGIYNFENVDFIETIHKGDDFDAFFFINPQPLDILKDYYELTGHPIFMPEYAFYEAHLNTFNRDYWVRVDNGVSGAILFEDGYYYKSYQPDEMYDKEGVLESLNGENDNYQFSARAMIDRYQRQDMPLGFFIPNDGYGSGYGQTDALKGDIENLKQFSAYAKSKGVEVALWTESNLEPKDPDNPKKGDRDLGKEVAVAGIVALKCDVAWIGSGYSFGLSAVEKATNIFLKESKYDIRPMIIMVDGWAGTQRYSGIWSGDQKGGEWEYIRFHIPTYIGSGLSGLPVVGSDSDGIYGGKDKLVNVRDYQWKTFTPLQLNMDGWGTVQKTPFSFDDEAKCINRAYLKLKSMLMPYNYTVSHQSIQGLPMVRAMFLEFPNENCGYTKDSQYQFMWGPYILVAPVYKENVDGNQWKRDYIYLPDSDQVWIDIFTGQKYQGGKIFNCVKTPLWKIPVFVKDGAIIPMTNPNNNPSEIKRDTRAFNIYPNGETSFEVYEDDGISNDYLKKHCAKTNITVIGPESNGRGDLSIHIARTSGSYSGMVMERTSLIRVMSSSDIEHIKAAINDDHIHINKVNTEEQLKIVENGYYFKEDYLINPYMRGKFFPIDMSHQKFLLIKIHKVDISSNDIHLKIKGYQNKSKVIGSNMNLNKYMTAPLNFTVFDDEITSSAITLRWNRVHNVYYEIERDGTIFTHITGEEFTFEDFKNETEHKFRIRSANDDGVSKWSYCIVVSTKENPHKYAVRGVEVACSVPCQPDQFVCNLTDCDPKTMWHTHWTQPHKADPQKRSKIALTFDLKYVYAIDRVEYTPRTDAGNGTILQMQYTYSVDALDCNPFSERIYWEHDETVKTIKLNGAKMRWMTIYILDSIGGFGSGVHFLFYKKV